jgi:hypothetical protein
MNHKEDFSIYIREASTDGSKRASSYIRAIELLDDILKRKAADLNGTNLRVVSRRTAPKERCISARGATPGKGVGTRVCSEGTPHLRRVMPRSFRTPLCFHQPGALPRYDMHNPFGVFNRFQNSLS